MHAMIISPFIRKELELTFYVNETTSLWHGRLSRDGEHIIEFHPQYLTRDGYEHSWKTNTLICRPSEFYYQPGRPQSLISLCPSEERLTIKHQPKNAEHGNCWMLHPIGALEVAGSILGSGPIVVVEIWSWNNLYGHSIQVRKLSVTDESMGTQYWLTA